MDEIIKEKQEEPRKELDEIKSNLLKSEEENASLKKKLERAVCRLAKANNYNEDLRLQIEELNQKLSKYKYRKTDVSTQTKDTEFLHQKESLLEDCSTANGSDTSFKNWTEEATALKVSIAESVAAAAQEAMQEIGIVYDENSGMYYDYKAGGYYNQDRSFYYDPNSGTYYNYDLLTQSYQFHSQIDPSSWTGDNNNVKNKKLKKTEENITEKKKKKLDKIRSSINGNLPKINPFKWPEKTLEKNAKRNENFELIDLTDDITNSINHNKPKIDLNKWYEHSMKGMKIRKRKRNKKGEVLIHDECHHKSTKVKCSENRVEVDCKENELEAEYLENRLEVESKNSLENKYKKNSLDSKSKKNKLENDYIQNKMETECKKDTKKNEQDAECMFNRLEDDLFISNQEIECKENSEEIECKNKLVDDREENSFDPKYKNGLNSKSMKNSLDDPIFILSPETECIKNSEKNECAEKKEEGEFKHNIEIDCIENRLEVNSKNSSKDESMEKSLETKCIENREYECEEKNVESDCRNGIDAVSKENMIAAKCKQLHSECIENNLENYIFTLSPETECTENCEENECKNRHELEYKDNSLENENKRLKTNCIMNSLDYTLLTSSPENSEEGEYKNRLEDEYKENSPEAECNSRQEFECEESDLDNRLVVEVQKLKILKIGQKLKNFRERQSRTEIENFQSSPKLDCKEIDLEVEDLEIATETECKNENSKDRCDVNMTKSHFNRNQDESEIICWEPEKIEKVVQVIDLDSSENSSIEDGECSTISYSETDSSSEEEEIEIEELKESWAPCIRVMVMQSLNVAIGTLFIVTSSGATIGRETYNDIFLPDITVSQKHAAFTYVESLGHYSIADLGSRNGTFLNDACISEPQRKNIYHVINHGDELILGGNTKLLLHIHNSTDTCEQCEPGLVQALTKPKEIKVIAVMSKEEKEKMRRKELKQIKRKFGLENSHHELNKNPDSLNYKDRSSQRRRIKGSDVPGEKQIEDEPPASIHRAIDSTNKGFKIMENMGWNSGQGLGKESHGITSPVTVNIRSDRSGLGSSQSTCLTMDNVYNLPKLNILNKTKERYFEIPSLTKKKKKKKWIKGSNLTES